MITKEDFKDIYEEISEDNPSLESNKREYSVFLACLDEITDEFVMSFAGNDAEGALRDFAWQMWKFGQMYKEVENGL